MQRRAGNFKRGVPGGANAAGLQTAIASGLEQ
jgi:hypothetical protein